MMALTCCVPEAHAFFSSSWSTSAVSLGHVKGRRTDRLPRDMRHRPACVLSGSRALDLLAADPLQPRYWVDGRGVVYICSVPCIIFFSTALRSETTMQAKVYECLVVAL
jgi:hypothetical protein